MRRAACPRPGPTGRIGTALVPGAVRRCPAPRPHRPDRHRRRAGRVRAGLPAPARNWPSHAPRRRNCRLAHWSTLVRIHARRFASRSSRFAAPAPSSEGSSARVTARRPHQCRGGSSRSRAARRPRRGRRSRRSRRAPSRRRDPEEEAARGVHDDGHRVRLGDRLEPRRHRRDRHERRETNVSGKIGRKIAPCAAAADFDRRPTFADSQLIA